MSVTEQTTSPSPPKRLVLPFVDTSPLFDFYWLVLLLPLWWSLGIEQFVWPVALVYITLKVLVLQQGRLHIAAPHKWFALYLVVILISSLFIVENYRWITFIRNFGAYLSGFLLLLIVTNRVRSWRDVDKLLDAALITLTVAGMVGLLAILGIWRPSFQSAIGGQLPGWITSTSYGQEIAQRTLGQIGWFVGLGYYYRLSSFFLFATHYASILVFGLPFLFYRFASKRGIQRILVGASILLLFVNLVFTTGRVALVALLGGGIYFMLFHSLRHKTTRFVSAVLMSLLVLALLLTSFVELTAPSEGGFVRNTAEAAQSFIFARGTGSYTSRFTVYEASLEGFMQRPAFGWGTERDVPESAYPAGSHSEYIAVLYRQGLIGILAFAGLILSTWRCSRTVSDARKRTPAGTFLRYGRWFFVTALINSIAADPVIDTTVYVFLWLFLALLVATAQFMRKEAHDPATAH